MSKHIWSGLEGSGKSLLMADCISEIAWRNRNWLLKQETYLKKHGTKAFKIKFNSEIPVARPIYSNLKLSDKFYNIVTKDYRIPVFYWEDLEDLIKISNADVFMDEVGNYFDSRQWTDLTMDCKRWLTQGSKTGIELYGTAQDFAQVDKAFRRLVNTLTHVVKLLGSRRPSPTKPPVKFIWGICFKRDLDPNAYDEDKKTFSSTFGGIIPIPYFIRKEVCELFDTKQIITKSKPMPFKHTHRECDHCSFSKIIHA